jgi:hypothetical protein
MSYNGWTNYATWRVNLELIDGIDPRDMGWDRIDVYDLVDFLKDFVDDTLAADCKQGVALDYARAFVSDVNWREIAKHMMEEYDLNEEEGEAA